MIKVTITNDILKKISAIDENRFSLKNIELPQVTKNRLRKNSKKKSSYSSNKIEGNPLTEAQANEAMERDDHKHFLKPEQEVRNYFLALNLLEEKLKTIADQTKVLAETTAVSAQLDAIPRQQIIKTNVAPPPQQQQQVQEGNWSSNT